MAWVFNPFTGTFDFTNTGGGGTPGGSSGQIQYNNAGAFGGLDLYYSSATLRLGAADVASGAVAQTLQVQSNTGAATTGPNFTIKGSAGTTAGGSIIFQTHNGTAYSTALTINSSRQTIFNAGTAALPSILFNTPTTDTIGIYSRFNSAITFSANGANIIELTNDTGSAGIININSNGRLQWCSGGAGSTGGDVILLRDALPNILALRNGLNAQTFNIYGTYTDASNYERCSIKVDSTAVTIANEATGSGFVRGINFSTGGLVGWSISPSRNFLAGADNAYDIGATSSGRPRNLYIGGSITLGGASITGPSGGTWGTPSVVQLAAGGHLLWSGRSRIYSEADGSITLYNNATTGFTSVCFGGTTSSFPALKRSTTTLQVRLADDSAYSNLAAAQLYSPPTALTSGATITWNANVSSVASLTLNDVGATLTMSNLVAGGTYLLIITQGTGGSKTITTWTNFKWAGGTAPVLSSTAGNIDVITAYSDGTYLYASAQIGFS